MPMPNPAATPPPSLAERLEALRARSGLGMNEVARRAGVGTGQLWEILHGRRDPRFSTVEKIVRAMGFTVADLGAGGNPKTPG